MFEAPAAELPSFDTGAPGARVGTRSAFCSAFNPSSSDLRAQTLARGGGDSPGKAESLPRGALPVEVRMKRTVSPGYAGSPARFASPGYAGYACNPSSSCSTTCTRALILSTSSLLVAT